MQLVSTCLFEEKVKRQAREIFYPVSYSYTDKKKLMMSRKEKITTIDEWMTLLSRSNNEEKRENEKYQLTRGKE